jgi:hypothetical protein
MGRPSGRERASNEPKRRLRFETEEEITWHLRSMTRHSGTDSIRRSMFVCAKTMRARAPHPQHVRHPDIRVLISSASDTIPLKKRLVPNVI